MSFNQPNVQTSVQQVDLDIDSWLSAPGADSVITPNAESEKPNIFSSKPTDLSFIDKDDEPADESTPAPNADPAKETPVSRETINVFDELDEPTEDPDPLVKKGGRPRTEKSGLVEFFKKRIESKEMQVFDDYDESKQSLDEYLGGLGEKDMEELWQANIDSLKQEVAAKTPAEFYESLPQELQYAAQYVANGGQDLKGLFQALAQVEEVRGLNPADENDQEGIVRQFLAASGTHNPEEIEEEIQGWKDMGVLEKKAKQFKPKLDSMHEQIVQSQLEEQQQRKVRQDEAAQMYMQNVFEALRPGEINGIKLDKKTQAMLYSGLVQPQYPSISGRPTNLLGHLLEHYQFVEPNYPLIAEALYLLQNPDEYRAELRKQGGNQTVENTVRMLKTEQSRKNISNVHQEEERTPRLKRPQNIFKR